MRALALLLALLAGGAGAGGAGACRAGAWSAWSRCNATCSTAGSRTRTRAAVPGSGCDAGDLAQTLPCFREPAGCGLCTYELTAHSRARVEQQCLPCGVRHLRVAEKLQRGADCSGAACWEQRHMCAPHRSRRLECRSTCGGAAFECYSGAWSACSAPCGGGEQTRPRALDVCDGPARQTRPCNTQPCPSQCSVGAWAHRGGPLWTRPLLRPAAAGERCEHALHAIVPDGVNASACAPAGWGPWTQCTAGCAPHAFRERYPRGLAGCLPAQLVQRERCAGLPACGNCSAGAWSPWSACANGTQRRVRAFCGREQRQARPCPEAADCGPWRPCVNGSRARTGCPWASEGCSPWDCVVSAWGPWSACTRPCGSGFRVRARRLLAGRCDAEALRETAACNTAACPACAFGPWSPWSPCFLGEQMRSRALRRGDASCAAHTLQRRVCDAPAPAPHCRYGNFSRAGACRGVCTQGSALAAAPRRGPAAGCPPWNATLASCRLPSCYRRCLLGRWRPEGPCSHACGANGSRLETRPVLHAYAGGWQRCAAAAREVPGCAAPCAAGARARDCDLGAWAAWSPCSATCGNGTQHRVRPLLRPARAGGRCGPRLQTRACNTRACAQQDCVMSAWREAPRCDGGLLRLVREVLVPPRGPRARPCGSRIAWRLCLRRLNCTAGPWGACRSGLASRRVRGCSAAGVETRPCAPEAVALAGERASPLCRDAPGACGGGCFHGGNAALCHALGVETPARGNASAPRRVRVGFGQDRPDAGALGPTMAAVGVVAVGTVWLCGVMCAAEGCRRALWGPRPLPRAAWRRAGKRRI